MTSSFSHIKTRLEQRQRDSLYRRRRVLDTPQGPQIEVDGTWVLSFCSNDYLGLANHLKVVEAFQKAAKRYGVGSGAAHLISGHSTPHHKLEEELAEFTGRERALLFSTGYMANIGVVTALLGRKDAVFEDRLNHASLLDAGLYSGAEFKRYQHADTEQLQSQLMASQAENKLVVTDGVFSMDGDIAPLTEISKVVQQNDAWLMVDDAHGFGVLGETGAGAVQHFGLSQQQAPVLMCTLGKAIGTFGAFVAGSDDLIEYLINEARTYVYTTALPPAVAEATRMSLKLVNEESWRRKHVLSLAKRFAREAKALGYQVMDSSTPIQPVVVGDAATALAMSEALLENEIWVSAIRPPTVPQGTARLRFTFNALHSESDINRVLDVLNKIKGRFL